MCSRGGVLRAKLEVLYVWGAGGKLLGGTFDANALNSGPELKLLEFGKSTRFWKLELVKLVTFLGGELYVKCVCEFDSKLGGTAITEA